MSMFAIGAVCVLCLGAGGISFVGDRSKERLCALVAFLLASGLIFCGMCVEGIPRIQMHHYNANLIFAHYRPYVELSFCLIGFLCSGLSSTVDCGRNAFRLMLLLIASAILFLFAYQSAYFSALLWGGTSFLVWREIARTESVEEKAHSRIFARYQLLSFVTFLIGSFSCLNGCSIVGVAAFIVSLSIRSGLFPFHSWIFSAFERLPLGVLLAYFVPQFSIVVVFTLIDGAYGEFLREAFALGGVVTAFYGASLALAPMEGRRSMAYLFMSQSGFVFFGLMSDNIVGLSGSLVTWVALSLSLVGFAMIFGCLEARKGPLTLHAPSGCYEQTPKMAVAFLLCGLASVGIPGTVLFLSEDLLLQSALEKLPLMAGMLIVATTLCAINVLRLYMYLFNGTKISHGESDFTLREFAVVSFLFCILAAGSLMPSLLF